MYLITIYENSYVEYPNLPENGYSVVVPPRYCMCMTNIIPERFLSLYRKMSPGCDACIIWTKIIDINTDYPVFTNIDKKLLEDSIE